jgi:uncharacterized integral membrane protein
VLIVAGLIAVFVIQNTARTDISFFGWTGRVPIAAALLLAALLGGVFSFLVAYVRQRAFRRALLRQRRTPPPPSAAIGAPGVSTVDSTRERSSEANRKPD